MRDETRKTVIMRYNSYIFFYFVGRANLAFLAKETESPECTRDYAENHNQIACDKFIMNNY